MRKINLNVIKINKKYYSYKKLTLYNKLIYRKKMYKYYIFIIYFEKFKLNSSFSFSVKHAFGSIDFKVIESKVFPVN